MRAPDPSIEIGVFMDADGRDEPLTATQMIDSVPAPPKRGWRRRDWLVVSGAAILGVLVARRIVRGARR